MIKCEFKDCTNHIRPQWTKGYCDGHAKQLQRHGESGLKPLRGHVVYLEDMLKKMPSYVTFKPGQEWVGVSAHYTFVCAAHGEFRSTPSRLMRNSWPKGWSGHPNNLGLRGREGWPVICVETGRQFASGVAASKELGLNRCAVREAMRRGHKCGGYTWRDA